MSKDKLGGKPEMKERKDVQERDDAIMNETGMGPGSGAQIAQHHREDSTHQKEFIKSQSRNASPGKGNNVQTP